jgi:signal transduction histidine kinase
VTISRQARSRIFDATLALSLGVLGLVEIWAPLSSAMGSGSPVSSSVGVLVTCAALSQRRRWPLGSLCVIVGILVLLAAVAPPQVLFYGTLVPLVITSYSVARYGSRQSARIGVGLMAALLLAVDLTVAELRSPGEIVFHWTVVIGAWAVGAVAHTREARAVEAEITARAAQEEARESARRERERIARELHDVIAHSVTTMVVQAGAAEQALDDRTEVAAALGAIRSTGTDALAELRRMLDVLRLPDEDPSLVPQPGLAALPGLIDQAREAGLTVRLAEVGQARALPAGLDLTAYRIVQESLTNIRRHSGASSAEVALTWGADALEIEVGDDGRGALDPETGHGIAGMRERAALYGGRVSTSSSPGAGFTVHALLPVAAS